MEGDPLLYKEIPYYRKKSIHLPHCAIQHKQHTAHALFRMTTRVVNGLIQLLLIILIKHNTNTHNHNNNNNNNSSSSSSSSSSNSKTNTTTTTTTDTTNNDNDNNNATYLCLNNTNPEGAPLGPRPEQGQRRQSERDKWGSALMGSLQVSLSF